MDVESASAILALLMTTLVIAFVAAAEVSLASTSRSRVRQWLDSGRGHALILDRLLDDPARFLSTLMLIKTAAYVAAGALTLWLALYQQMRPSTAASLVALIWFSLLTVQILGRALTLRRPERFALRLGNVVNGLTRILTPLSFPLRSLGLAARRGAREATPENIFLSEDGLRFLIHVGDGEGIIEEGEKQMIAGIFELSETAVREIMVPRLDVVALSVETGLDEALDTVIEKGHSRIPVFEESIDQIIGFLYAKDVLRCLREDRTGITIRQMLRPAYFVPQSKKLDELFQEMQLRHVHIAVVVDEYGGTSGLVTIEDLLEEIVGEIQDEYDREEPLVQQLGQHAFLFNARLDLDDVSELIQVDLTSQHDAVDTLGGFIYSQLGRVPERGETVEYAGWRFTVISVDSRRIEQVRVERRKAPQGAGAEMISDGPSPNEIERPGRSGILRSAI